LLAIWGKNQPVDGIRAQRSGFSAKFVMVCFTSFFKKLFDDDTKIIQ
jgi:hypothetical protein